LNKGYLKSLPSKMSKKNNIYGSLLILLLTFLVIYITIPITPDDVEDEYFDALIQWKMHEICRQYYKSIVKNVSFTGEPFPLGIIASREYAKCVEMIC